MSAVEGGLVHRAMAGVGRLCVRRPWWVIAGWLVFTNELQPDQLGFGAVDAVVSTSVFWLIVFFAVAVVGMAFQIATTQEYIVTWDEEYPWESPTSPSTPSAPSTP